MENLLKVKCIALSRREMYTGKTGKARGKEEERNDRDKGRQSRERGGGRGILIWAGDGITRGFPLEWVEITSVGTKVHTNTQR